METRRRVYGEKSGWDVAKRVDGKSNPFRIKRGPRGRSDSPRKWRANHNKKEEKGGGGIRGRKYVPPARPLDGRWG